MTLEEAQEKVNQWIEKYGVRYFDELTNLAMLTEEVGELASVMSRKFGDQSYKDTDSRHLDDELADVLFVLICIANQSNINLTQALNDNLIKKTERDNNRHLNNKKL